MARILVVDDEEGIREFFAETLSIEGHEVERAPDGAAALEVLASESFDVVLTDLKMPRVDGFALLEHLQREEPATQVIVLTAHGSVGTAVDAMRRGAFDFLEKPVESPEALCERVDRAIAHKRLQSRARVAETSSSLTLGFGDPAMATVVEALTKVAKTDATVLLRGESGTGKEVAARAIHQWSPRSEGPFVAINCAAVAGSLLESELFGHERGAFTGAHAQRQGRVELAAGGTFFLDEVGDMEPALQAKLLRVLQERSFERVGGTRTIRADVRWIAATNRDLQEAIANGSFREDLYHRLAVFPVTLPPLRDRTEDILPLARGLLSQVGIELGRRGLTLSDVVGERLLSHAWPGNVRELRNALERAAILADGETIGPEHIVLDSATRPAAPVTMNLEALERQAIVDALAAEGGNRKNAAERLGIGVRTLYDKLKRYDLH